MLITSYSKKTFQQYKAHTLAQIKSTPVGESPFYHVFIENILPDELFCALESRLAGYRKSDKVKNRDQDSAGFVNKRFNFEDCSDPEVSYVRNIFSDFDVKQALVEKFYLEPTKKLINSLKIHEKEFEFTLTEANRFQNIHMDIPAKFLSFVFYYPQSDLSQEDKLKNATILYDKDLKPAYNALYQRNSVCVFSAHYYSYHGFSTTVDRPVMVMFYINDELFKKWKKTRDNETPPYNELKDSIHEKLLQYPLIEYEVNTSKILAEKNACKVNAPRGRVMVDSFGVPLPLTSSVCANLDDECP